MAGFQPVLDAAVVYFDIVITQGFNGNCRLIGENSPVAHSVGDNQFFLVAPQPVRHLMDAAPGKIDGARDGILTVDDLVQAIDQQKVDLTIPAIFQHYFQFSSGNDIESFQGKSLGGQAEQHNGNQSKDSSHTDSLAAQFQRLNSKNQNRVTHLIATAF
jgi:hypothetical protein